MREIKFRGKRVDNGEWVYGYYLVDEDDGYPLPTIFTPSGLGDKNIGDGLHHVDPATVGQYTGMEDINGKEIYEGDIVIDERGGKAYVAFLRQEMGYVLVFEKHDSRLGHRNRGSDYDSDFSLEIIGNIYENPELLKNKNNMKNGVEMNE